MRHTGRCDVFIALGSEPAHETLQGAGLSASHHVVGASSEAAAVGCGWEHGIAERDRDEEAKRDHPNTWHKKGHDLRNSILVLVPKVVDPEPVVYKEPN